jgi:Transposase domain (DUF772)
VTGRPAYAPGDLLKLYIYGYLNRVRSSRRLEALVPSCSQRCGDTCYQSASPGYVAAFQATNCPRRWCSVDEEFVPDSPLERGGFEPSVPPQQRHGVSGPPLDGRDRLRPEPLQFPGKVLRQADRYLRRSWPRVHSVVPAGCWWACTSKLPARPNSAKPWRYAEPDRARLAVATVPGYAANSRNVLDCSS